MKKLYLILLIINCLFASKEVDFLKTLNEVSEIATKTKLNIDKIPSNVEVINRDFIVKSGARTLLDIIKYLPGIEISISASGKRQIIVRGNKSTFRDKIKFLINGHEVTNNLYSNQFYYYNFPASLIKRIEFTKTPDAVMYGDKAFLGVINIITLDELDENQLSFYQSDKKQTTFSLFDKINNSTLIDTHYEISNPTIQKTKTYQVDITKKPPKPVKVVRYNRPNEFEKEAGLGIRYKKNHSKLSYRIQYFKKGNFFGVINLPPLPHDKHIEFIHQYINYNYSKFLSDNIKNSFDFGIKHYQWRGEFRVYPPDLNFSDPDKDFLEGALIKEYELYLNNNITYNTKNHTINFIIETKYAKPYHSEYYQHKVTEPKKYYPLFSKNVDRKIFSIALEDLYILKDNFSIIYGGRYSHYNDFGDDFSYKLGGVYNLNKNTTFKLLYNTAFRAPSWIELYSNTDVAFHGNPNLKSEKIRMLEFTLLQKIFKKDKLQITIYRGKTTNYIGKDIFNLNKSIYENLGDVIIKGFEINYKKIYDKGYFAINYSYNDNKNLFFTSPYYSRVRKNMLKTYNIYNINNHLSLFGSIIYNWDPDVRKQKKQIHFDYFTLNTNINYHKKNFSIIFGIDNLTDYKNYYFVLPTDVVKSKYIFMQENSGIPLSGRKIYLSIVKKWQ